MGGLGGLGLRFILSTPQGYSITLLNRGVTISVTVRVGWSVGCKGLPRPSVMVRSGAKLLRGGLVAVAVEAAGTMLNVFADVLRPVALVPSDVVECGGELFSFLMRPVG